MCGINGIVTRLKVDDTKEIVHLMNQLIQHRGPDDEGIYQDENLGYSISLGMQRLAIIDLDNGNQPFISDDNNIILVFNGEIYNYLELRDKLEKQYVTFLTNSDTEVILRLYEKYGSNFAHYLDGMYAISIYNRSEKCIYLYRDFFGEKPLYYTLNKDQFIFGSELKSIVSALKFKPIISFFATRLYFQLTYIPAPYTIYEDIFKLEPNHKLILSLDNFTLSKEKISSIEKRKINLKEEDALKIIHDSVFDSVKSRMVSDVPIGSFLSGGVDSSIISLCLAELSNKKINTFSIGFENKKFDESTKSNLVASLIKSDHNLLVIKEKELLENVSLILNNFDEPFGDSSAIPSYLLSQFTREKVKVALTGDGGDEVFGGYNKYHLGRLNTIYTNIVNQNFHAKIKQYIGILLKTKSDNRGSRFKIKKMLESIDYENKYYQNIVSLGFKSAESPHLFNDNNFEIDVFEYYLKSFNAPINSLNDFRHFDYLTSLEGDMLVKVDRTSMMSSLECRSPFLNRSIWEFSFQIPEDYLLRNFSKKYLLKESFAPYFPSNFFEQPKQGFGVPIGDWLRTVLREELLKYCEKTFLVTQGLFKVTYINKMVNNHLEMREDNTFKIWAYFCFQKWYLEIYDQN